ncbi:MAG: hypothetical protein WC928_00935 [Patescibacteria group bacterium]|jgi:hypothetical protein
MNFEKKGSSLESKANLSSASLEDKVKNGLLARPEEIKVSINRLREELKNDLVELSKSYVAGGKSNLEKSIGEKENLLILMEKRLDSINKEIETDFSLKGPENFELILKQEEKILETLDSLGKTDLSLVKKTRDKIHLLNVNDGVDFFSDPNKIIETIETVSQEGSETSAKLVDSEEVEEKVEISDKGEGAGSVEENKDEISGQEIESNYEFKTEDAGTEETREPGFEDDKITEREERDDFRAVSLDDDDLNIPTKLRFDESSAGSDSEEREGDYKYPRSEEDDREDGENSDKKKKETIFEVVRKNKKLTAAIIGVCLLAVGIGCFRNKDKKADKVKDDKATEAPAPVFEEKPEIINAPVIEFPDSTATVVEETPEIDPIKEIKTKISESGVDTSKIGNDLLQKIYEDGMLVEDSSYIDKVIILEAGDGIGEITKDSITGNKNIMPGATKINLVDNKTGEIFKDHTAQTVLVHPGDIVIRVKDKKGEVSYYVIADKKGLNYKAPEKKVVSEKVEKTGEDLPEGFEEVPTIESMNMADFMSRSKAQFKDSLASPDKVSASEGSAKDGLPNKGKKSIKREDKVKKPGFFKKIFGTKKSEK